MREKTNACCYYQRIERCKGVELVKLVRQLLIMGVVTVLMLLASEGIARVVFWRNTAPPPPQGFGYSRVGYGDLIPYLDVVEHIRPNPPYWLRTNSLGLRNVEEFRGEAWQLMALGDSFIYGFYVHNLDTFPARLEEVLEEKTEQIIQVLNAGIPGYTVADMLSYWRDKGSKLTLYGVIIGVYTNDVFGYHPRMREYFSREAFLKAATYPPDPQQQTLLATLRDNSALMGWLLSLREEYQQQQIRDTINRITPYVPGLEGLYEQMTFFDVDNSEYRSYWEQYEADLRTLVAEIGDLPMVIVVFPDNLQLPQDSPYGTRFQEVTARIAADLDVPLVDLLPVLRKADNIQGVYLKHYDLDAPYDDSSPTAYTMRYVGDGHLNSYGNLVAARAVGEVIAKLGWVTP